METLERKATKNARGELVMEPYLDQNITCAVPWTNPEATPVANIDLLARIAATRYGIKYDWLAIHPGDLRNAALAKEFKYRCELGYGETAESLKAMRVDLLANLLTQFVGVEVKVHPLAKEGEVHFFAKPDSINVVEHAVLRV